MFEQCMAALFHFLLRRSVTQSITKTSIIYFCHPVIRFPQVYFGTTCLICFQKVKAVSSVTVTVYKIQQSSSSLPARFLIYQNVSVYTNTRDEEQEKEKKKKDIQQTSPSEQTCFFSLTILYLAAECLLGVWECEELFWSPFTLMYEQKQSKLSSEYHI